MHESETRDNGSCLLSRERRDLVLSLDEKRDRYIVRGAGKALVQTTLSSSFPHGGG